MCIRFVLCFRFGHSEHLLPAVVPHGAISTEEQPITSMATTSAPYQSSQFWAHAGGTARPGCASLLPSGQGQPVCPCSHLGKARLCPSHVPPKYSLSCPDLGALRTMSSSLAWSGEAAVPANGMGESPAASQRSGVLQTMEAPAPHTSLSKEPCL